MVVSAAPDFECVCVCAVLQRNPGTNLFATGSRPTTRNEAVGESEQGLISLCVLANAKQIARLGFPRSCVRFTPVQS